MRSLQGYLLSASLNTKLNSVNKACSWSAAGKVWAALTVAVLLFAGVSADNPVVKHRFTADPSGHVWPTDPDTLYIYVSHDPDNATSHDQMIDYYVYSTKDMVHWEEHGPVLHLGDVSWASWKAWAPDAAYVNGTYYFVYCAMPEDSSKTMQTGLAVSDRPEGPFTDIGWIEGVEWGQDPCLFIDDDGTPYLFWGLGGSAWSVQLTPDLKSAVPDTLRKLNSELPKIYEGPWVYKNHELGLYYIMYPTLRDPNEGQALEYATAHHPMGPWTHRGELMPYRGVSGTDSWTNHGSIVKFKGQWYLLYHVAWQSKYNDKRRNVAVEYLQHNADGTIDPIMPTHEGVGPAGQPRATEEARFLAGPGSVDAAHPDPTHSANPAQEAPADAAGGAFDMETVHPEVLIRYLPDVTPEAEHDAIGSHAVPAADAHETTHGEGGSAHSSGQSNQPEGSGSAAAHAAAEHAGHAQQGAHEQQLHMHMGEEQGLQARVAEGVAAHQHEAAQPEGAQQLREPAHQHEAAAAGLGAAHQPHEPQHSEAQHGEARHGEAQHTQDEAQHAQQHGEAHVHGAEHQPHHADAQHVDPHAAQHDRHASHADQHPDPAAPHAGGSGEAGGDDQAHHAMHKRLYARHFAPVEHHDGEHDAGAEEHGTHQP